MKHHRKKKEKPDDAPKRHVDTMEFLPVAYTPAQLLEMGTRLARTTQEKEQVEERFESLKADHKATTESLDKSLRQLTRQINVGTHYENVDCAWILEMPTHHEKQLVRKDTCEIVRTVPMERGDYQEVLIPAAIKSDVPLVATGTAVTLPPAKDGKAAAAKDSPEQGALLS